MEHLNTLKDFILITFGAALGANTRFIIYQKLEKINLSKNNIILLINTFSSFLLGLCLSFSSQIDSFTYSYQSWLFFSIGLLGSLSTFSTFILDLFKLLNNKNYLEALLILLASMLIGIAFALAGFVIGNG